VFLFIASFCSSFFEKKYLRISKSAFNQLIFKVLLVGNLFHYFQVSKASICFNPVIYERF
jgi:hypothetical protein